MRAMGEDGGRRRDEDVGWDNRGWRMVGEVRGGDGARGCGG